MPPMTIVYDLILEAVSYTHLMSIISLMFMLLASMNGANMFGRLARYFVLGSVVALPWIIDSVFNKRSAQLLKNIAAICYFAFFLYDNQIFSQDYKVISIWEFFA